MSRCGSWTFCGHRLRDPALLERLAGFDPRPLGGLGVIDARKGLRIEVFEFGADIFGLGAVDPLGDRMNLGAGIDDAEIPAVPPANQIALGLDRGLEGGTVIRLAVGLSDDGRHRVFVDAASFALLGLIALIAFSDLLPALMGHERPVRQLMAELNLHAVRGFFMLQMVPIVGNDPWRKANSNPIRRAPR